tara:strand:+ start:1649 stop:2302 length:654 start_codon:yes stop_codon:yes gene_type:complete
MTGQLIFNLINIRNFNPEDFYVNDNNLEASELIKLWPNWFNGAVVIYGPTKSGKSHLANIWKENSNANIYNLEDDLLLSNIDTKKDFVLDNFHNLSANDEEIFFHIYNQTFNNKKNILITLDKSKFNKINLKDLESRFNSFSSATINPPDDNLVNALIVKFFKDQQINIDPSVITFIINRIERDYGAIFNFLKKIDNLSLENKTKISIPFLNKFFDF